MSELRTMLTDLGFANPRTLLQSGNVVFDSHPMSDSEVERLLEAETEKRLGVATTYMVRSHEELAALVPANPFPGQARDDPGHLLVLFLKSAPDEGRVEELRKAIKGRETVELLGNHLFAVYPDGIGTSKLTTTMIEAKLGTKATGRNWNTVLKLLEMA